MADETILNLVTRVDLGPLKAGMSQAASAVKDSTDQMKSSFSSAAAADQAVIQRVQQSTAAALDGFAKMKGGGIFAFDAVRAKMIEATAEVGRLRAQILETNDAATLEHLNNELRIATAEMSAARTEMRALGFEARETTEKANLLGESLGVKIPGALGSLLGRIPGVQQAMAAAFSVAVVGIFIDAIAQATEKIGGFVEDIAGYGKEVQKLYKEALDANHRLIVSSIELNEKAREIGTVGTVGAAKFAIEQKNAAATTQEMVRALVDAQKHINELQPQMEGLKQKTEFLRDPLTGLTSAKRDFEEASISLEHYKKIVDELEPKLRAIQSVTLPKARAEEQERQHVDSVADEKAASEARKTINESYLDFYLNGLKQMFAAGKINRDAEVEGEIAVVQAKIEQERRFASERLAELAKSPAGTNTVPEQERINSELLAKEAAAQAKINEIRETAGQEQIAHANAVSLALANAAKTSADAEISLAEQSARQQLAARRISIDQETSILKSEGAKRFAAEREVLEEELRIASQVAGRHEEQVIGINARLHALAEQQAAEEERLDAESAAKKIELIRRQVNEQVSAAERIANIQLSGTRQLDNERLRSQQITLSQWEANELKALQDWYDAQSAALNKALALARQTFGEESTEYQRLIDKMRELDLRRAADMQSIDERVSQRFQQTMNVISSSFSSAFDRMLTEHTKFSTVMTNFWNQMVQGWARMGIQILGEYIQTLAKILIQEILTQAHITTVHTGAMTARQATENAWDSFLTLLGIKRVATATTQETTQTAAHAAGVAARQATDTAAVAAAIATTITKDVVQITSLAGLAGAAGFASAMVALPFPVNISTAPGVAAAAIAGTLANLSIGSAAGGMEVTHDQLLRVHANEHVLPASIASAYKQAAAGGGNGGGTKVMHVRPQITIHSYGTQDHQDMQERVETAVRRAVRAGSLGMST